MDLELERISPENSEVIARICANCLRADSNRYDFPGDESVKCLLGMENYSQQITHLVLSQLQPHFLFNVLNMIYYMIGKEPETAKNMVNDFSTYLRTNMNALQNPVSVPLEQEIAHVHLYLRFEQMRFRDRFHMEYDIACTDFKLPPLTLQPLVENAVRHGVCPMDGGGIVRIESAEEEDAYVARVIDNGVGFDVSSTVSGGRNNLGLSVIRSRIEEISGGSLLVHSAPGRGTIVEVRVPKEAGL